jgi:hypothetical protein
MPDKQTTPLGIRTTPETREALKKAVVGEEARSQAALVEKILRDWLREHGYLPERSKGVPRRRG